jgi:nuclear transport factor 2 (NTF2) superfamily protein
LEFDFEIFAKSYAQAWSGRRPQFVALYFEENGSLRVNDGAAAEGREEISKVAQGFMTDLPDMLVRFDSLVTKTKGTEFHWTLIATNSGPGGTGNKVKVSGFELWQIGENGLIQKSQGNFPSEEYNRQLEFGLDK